MLPKKIEISSKKLRRLQSVWERLNELFPGMEDSLDYTVSWSPPYMSWQIEGVVPAFWDKVVLPLVKELEPLGARSAKNRLVNGVYYIQIPFTPYATSKFREWVKYRDGKEDEDDPYGYYDDDYDDEYSVEAQAINDNPVYDDEFYQKKGW